MATTAEKITALQTMLDANIGVGQVTVDGVTVRYERAQAQSELKALKRQLGRENGTRPVCSQVRLDRF